MGEVEKFIEAIKLSIYENKRSINSNNFILSIGLILLFTLIFSGSASAATDLTFTKINASDYGSPGKTITINTTVTNQGDRDSNGFYIKHYHTKGKTINCRKLEINFKLRSMVTV